MLRAIARIIQLGNLFWGDITRTTEQARMVRGQMRGAQNTGIRMDEDTARLCINTGVPYYRVT